MTISHASDESNADYISATEFLDFETAAVQAFAEEATAGAADDVGRAVGLYYAVRDGIRYNPYTTEMMRERMRASWALRVGEGFCVQKAIVLAAAARAVGIPARLSFADVRNHLTTPKLRALMGTDVFKFHGLTELRLEGKWVKATPTFNLSLCERFGVKPLDFDGRSDAILHPLDSAGQRHMEYLHDYGSYADLPFEEMARVFKESYGAAFQTAVAERDDRDAFEEDAPAPS